MATSVDLNIITGRTGTAHVSSADDAAIWRGLVGNSNVTLFTDEQLALNHSTKGKLVVSDGVLCIGGRMGRISNTKTVDYALPESGYYRRTLLVARYTISNNIESMTLLTLQSNAVNDATTSAAAANLSISTNASTDYVLYDFVCDADGVVSGTLQTKLTVMDTIPLLRAALNAEESARTAADTNILTTLGNRISQAESVANGAKWEKLTITDNEVSAAYDLYIITVQYTGRSGTEETTVVFDRQSYGAQRIYCAPPYFDGSSIVFRRFRLIRIANKIQLNTASVPTVSINQNFVGTQTYSDAFTMTQAFAAKAVTT